MPVSQHGHETTTAAADPLVAVALQGYPLQLSERATQYYDEVFREFALLAADDHLRESVPARLTALIGSLGRRYPRQEAFETEREAAVERGEVTRDFRLQLPASAAEACRELDRMLDEADEFCRDGVLLTLAAPAEVVDFRRWYLREIADQIAGSAPRPWAGALT